MELNYKVIGASIVSEATMPPRLYGIAYDKVSNVIFSFEEYISRENITLLQNNTIEIELLYQQAIDKSSKDPMDINDVETKYGHLPEVKYILTQLRRDSKLNSLSE